jgi:hypothetical protein
VENKSKHRWGDGDIGGKNLPMRGADNDKINFIKIDRIIKL